MYTVQIDNGSEIHINYGGGRKFQDEMLSRGWRLELCKDVHESPETLYNRLSRFYKVVKIYWTSTMIRGIHEYYAFCK